MQSALRKQDGAITLKGQRLRKSDLRRSRMHVCPRCLLEDMAGSDLPPAIAIHGRANWMLQAIRTCPVHEIALVEVARDVPVHDTHDWTLNVAPVVPRLEELANTAMPRRPSALESYLLNRLDGQPIGTWLDNLEFYAAVHVTVLIGAVAAFGKRVTLDKLSEDDNLLLSLHALVSSWSKKTAFGRSLINILRCGRNRLNKTRR